MNCEERSDPDPPRRGAARLTISVHARSHWRVFGRGGSALYTLPYREERHFHHFAITKFHNLVII
jgi:hypothetical protein